ncbi:MAG: hypothetical protein ACKV19_26180 [Verrucomicrobiales bacterium]
MNEKPTRPSLKKLLIANAILWVTCLMIVVVTPNFVSSPEKARFPTVMAMLIGFTSSCGIIRQARR